MPARTRVIIDTSVFISAVLTPGGTAYRAVAHALTHHLVVSSGDTMLELEEKLTAGKFKSVLSAEDVEDFLESIVQGVEFFVPTVFRTRARDPADDMFLDLAETVGASFLITGDKDLLSLANSHGVPGLQIIQPAEFLRLTLRSGLNR